MLLVDGAVANVTDGDIHEFLTPRSHDDVLYASCENSMFVIVSVVVGVFIVQSKITVSSSGTSGVTASMDEYVNETLEFFKKI